MKKISIILAAVALLGTQLASAQTYVSRNAHVWFFSETPVENIEAHNHKAASILNAATGALTFKMNIKAFEFEKALMQEHFNENYMESDKYPSSDFKGTITNLSAVDFAKNGTYNVTVKGDLSIHGVKKAVTVPGTLTVKNGAVSTKAVFNVLLADYGVTIPAAVKNQISKTIQITVDSAYILKK